VSCLSICRSVLLKNVEYQSFNCNVVGNTVYYTIVSSIQSFSSDDGSLDSSKINKFLDAPKKESKPWWMQSDDEEEEDDGGNFGSGFKSNASQF